MLCAERTQAPRRGGTHEIKPIGAPRQGLRALLKGRLGGALRPSRAIEPGGGARENDSDGLTCLMQGRRMSLSSSCRVGVSWIALPLLTVGRPEESAWR